MVQVTPPQDGNKRVEGSKIAKFLYDQGDITPDKFGQVAQGIRGLQARGYIGTREHPGATPEDQAAFKQFSDFVAEKGTPEQKANVAQVGRSISVDMPGVGPSGRTNQPAAAPAPPREVGKIQGMIMGKGGVGNLELAQINQNIKQLMDGGYTPTSLDKQLVVRLQKAVQKTGSAKQIQETMAMGKALGLPELAEEKGQVVGYNDKKRDPGMPDNRKNIDAAKAAGPAPVSAGSPRAEAPAGGAVAVPVGMARPVSTAPSAPPAAAQTPAPTASAPAARPAAAPAGPAVMAVTGKGVEVKPFNEKTQLLQAYLKGMGIETGPLDGQEGPKTRKGLEEYARKYPTGIPEGGLAKMSTDDLLKHMRTRMNGDIDLAKTMPLKRMIDGGNQESAQSNVKAAQLVLADLGYKGANGKPLPTDGIVSPDLRRAGEDFARKTQPIEGPKPGTQTMTYDEFGTPKIVGASGATPVAGFGAAADPAPAAAPAPMQPAPQQPFIAPPVMV